MADNQRDMVAKGRADTGRRVLGEANASIIRERFAAGELARTLAAEFGVSKATIWDVVRGRKYRSADGPISPQTWRPADTDANRASVAALMDSGMSNRAIGRMLDISHHAVAKIKKGLQDG
jgi:DNA invertase Pin-like site-specific DNA recombinase